MCSVADSLPLPKPFAHQTAQTARPREKDPAVANGALVGRLAQNSSSNWKHVLLVSNLSVSVRERQGVGP